MATNETQEIQSKTSSKRKHRQSLAENQENVVPKIKKPNDAPQPFGRYLCGEIVEIQVEAGNQSSFVHKELAMSRCPYLKKCLSSDFSEAQTRKIVIKEITAEAFEIVLEYIYTSDVHEVPRDPYYPQENFINAYIAADRFCMESLMNLLTDRLREFFRRRLPTFNAFDAFDASELEDSLLEKHMLEIAAFRLYVKKDGTVAHAYPGLDLLLQRGGEQVLKIFDLVRELDRHQKNPYEAHNCDYHYHTETPSCRARSDGDGQATKKAKASS